MDREFINLIEAFMAVNNKIYDAKDSYVTFSNDIKLKTGAIHLIEVIGNNPCSNITTVSHKLGVTKGAISQQITKLMDKDLIISKKKPQNNKEVVLELLPKGEIVFKEHEKAHKELYDILSNELMKFSDKDQKKMIELFNLIGHYVDIYKQGFI